MKLLMKGLMFFATLLMAVSVANAAIDPAKVQKLLAGDGEDWDLFGGRVAIAGDTAVIGVIFDNDKGGGPARPTSLSGLLTARGASRPSSRLLMELLPIISATAWP